MTSEPRAATVTAYPWRRLFAAVATPVAVAWLVTSLPVFLGAAGEAAVLDGRPPALTGGAARGANLVWLFAWMFAFLVGVILWVSARHGRPVGAGAAYRRALRRLPVAAGLLVPAGAALAGTFGCAGSLGSATAAILLIVVVGVLVVAWLVLGLAVVAVEPGSDAYAVRRAWSLASGRRGRLLALTIGVFLVLPLIAGGAGSWLTQVSGSVWVTALAMVAALAVLVALVVVQAAAVGGFYAAIVPAGEPGPDVEPAKLRWVTTLLPLILAPLLVVAIALVNPAGVPVLASGEPARGDHAAYGFTMSAAGDAVFAGSTDILRCDDLACGGADDEPVEFAGGVISTLNGLSAVAPDGTFIDIGQGLDGQRVTVCPVAPPCTWTTAHVPGFGFSEQRAMVVTGDGVVLASVESYVANGRVGFGVVISRCDDHTCARSIRLARDPLPGDPQRDAGRDSSPAGFLADPADERPSSWGDSRTKFALGLDDWGRPVVAWAKAPGLTVNVLRCDDPDCHGFAGRTLDFTVDTLDGAPRPTVAALGIDPHGNPAVAVHTYAPRPATGFHVRWGAAPKDRIVMVRCTDGCHAHVWHDLEADQQDWSYQMAFRPGGSPILMEGVDRLVWCEHNCG